ncbi:MAG: aminoglycoside phosphotransferase family protein, partial [Alphaproteobacteria bacterium]
AEITAALVRMGLARPGEKPCLEPLTGGISSLIVLADTSSGRLCVKRALPQLKVAVEWKVPVDRNSAEVGWMRIAERVAPGSVPTILGEDAVGMAFAMAYLDPADYPVWKSQLLEGIAEPATAKSVADILSRVHNECAGDLAVARDFANDANFHAIRLDPYFGAAATVHSDLADQLGALIVRTGETRLTLVHGDISPKNILVGPDGPLILDAECAWYGDPAFDLAFCLAHLLLKCVPRPSATPSYLACFDAFASGNISRCGWETPSALEARTATMLAGMVLARIDGKSTVEYITNGTEKDRVRRFARHFLVEPVERLGIMRDAWSREWNR